MRSDTIAVGGQSFRIDGRWDDEAGVWSGTSQDIHGLVVEAETWSALLEEARLVLPDLIELSAIAPR
jgi:uncharacterized protein DUF1902